MPLVIDITKCRRLGEHRGRTSYVAEQRLELEERGELLDPAREVVPDGPAHRVRKDGDVLLQGLQPHLRGTFASRTSTVPKTPKPKTVSNRPSNSLDTVQVFTGSGSRASPAVANRRKMQGVLAKLARRGVGVHRSADGSGLVVMGAGTYIEAMRAATSVLLPWLRNGVAPSCQVSKHKTPVPAITVATGGPDNIPYCGECQP